MVGSCPTFRLCSALLIVGACSGVGASVRAADTEVREFNVAIDGNSAGQYVMTMTRQDDGTIQMSGKCDTQFRVLAFLKYTYSFQGAEVWKDRRLVRLDTTGNDNGKKLAVQAAAGPDGLRVTANGETQLTRADAWPTTYWSLPDPKLRNEAVTLLDADTGRIIPAKLDYVGPAQLTVDGKEENCARYRLTGGVRVELWYDGKERLLHQEWVEDGHRVALNLVRIQR